MKSLPRSRADARISGADSQQAQDFQLSQENSGASGLPGWPGVRSAPAGPVGRKASKRKGSGASLGTTAKSAVVLGGLEGFKALNGKDLKPFSSVEHSRETITQISSGKPGFIDPETGEILGVEEPFDPMLFRVQRFACQSVVRVLMGSSRTSKCLRWRQVGRQVEVWKSREYRTASYSGLQTCGSVWACPVCAAKVAERRRSEIIAAMVAHKAAGGGVFLLTLTAPHQRGDGIGELLAKHGQALRRFWSLKAVRKVLEEMGSLGQIRAAEVTHGRRSEFNNGWHPHHHVLLFLGVGGDCGAVDEASRKDWAVRLYLQWSACCEAFGLGLPSFAHGLKLDDGSKASAYVSKWGLEDEMTKGHTKKASKGETPFDFLRAILADATDKQAGVLFVEFAEAFKGKRQLTWSPGLKKRFAIGELSDEELAAKQDDLALLLGTLTVDQWRDVLRVEGRGLLLQLAAGADGWEAVERYLSGIASLVPAEVPC